MNRLLAAFALGLGVCTAPAAAQSVFVEGTAFAGIERRTHTEIVESDITAPGPLDLNGTVAGGGFGVGTWLTPHVTVRLQRAPPAPRSSPNPSHDAHTMPH